MERMYRLSFIDFNIQDIIDMLPPFSYASMGMLAYIGNDRAIADLPGGIKLGGIMTFYFWRSAYLSNLFSWRNKILVAGDWMKRTVFGRDIGRE
jgi:NADH:ubiquinone reductase (non-electrogenic)